jgi:EAL domain-containing protein (putative c-di-GMP-specific phosphodiesterase class I)
VAELTQTLNDDAYLPQLREFDITYSTELLLNKAAQHCVNLDQSIIEITVNLAKLEIFHTKFITAIELNQSYQNLLIAIATSSNQFSKSTITEYFNNFISLYLSAFLDGLEIINIIEALNCLEPSKTISNSRHWTAFLTDIVTESIVSYQNYQINYLLDYDPITNLPNTKLLLEDIEQKTRENPDHDNCLYTFRFIIERGSVTVSPIVPTTLNAELVRVMTQSLPEETVIYQNGNLLFSALIEKSMSDTQLNLLSVKFQHEFEQIINIDRQAFIISPVMSAIQHVNSTNSPSVYYNQSRAGLRHALENNKPFVIYNYEIELADEKQKQIELEVTTAFNDEELELYLQPIVGLPNELCVGAEVLLRWPNAKNKGIYPNVVVEIINKVGLGKLFTRWLIHSVCRLANEIKNKHDLSIYLTLNLRAEDLYDVELPHLLIQGCNFWKISPDDVVLEITENGILEETEVTLGVISQITGYGFKLALDDFGTGYSSMARLRTLPISIIKIDQSFVKKMNENKNDCNMVESMSSLAKSLGKDVLVEGLENAESLALIKQMGIPKAQGYYFSKPMAFNDFINWAKNNLST